ncbi:MAG: oligosaccharide flippase family protein [Nanopusillaceae archaeon]
MKIVFYSEGKDLKKIIYNATILKNLKKDVYIFINNFQDSEILKKIKEKIKVNFIISKKKIKKVEVLKIIKEKFRDDILFIEGNINFNIKKIKNLEFNKNIVRFGYNSKILKLLNLNILTRIIFFKNNVRVSELLKEIEENMEVDINLDYFIEKQFILDILTAFKKLLKNLIKIINKIYEKKIIKDLINEKIGFISLKFFTFLLMIILSRFLAVELYGRYVNFHSLIISFATIISLSIPTYKFFSEKREERFDYIINSLFLYFLNSLIIFFILVIFKNFFFTVFNTNNILILPAILLTSIFFTTRVLLSHLFFSDLKFDINKYFDILEGALKLILVLFFSIITPAKGAILGIFFTFFILNLIELIFTKKHYPELFKKIKFRINFTKLKELLKYGILINYSNIILSFYNSFRYSFISYLKGLVEISLYYNALNVVYILSNLLSLYNILLPRILRWSKDEIKKKIKFFFFIQILIYISLALIIIIFSDKIILLLFGEKYIEASKYLKLSSLLLPIFSLSIFHNLLWLKSYLKEISIINLIYLISFILLDILLIPKIGIFGAILSNISSTAFCYILSFIFFKIKI